MTVAARVKEIVEVLEPLGLPIHLTTEGSGSYRPGINVYRLTRPDLPSRDAPYRGIFVQVMYEPQGESEARHEEWAAQVREALLRAFPDRYRPLMGGIEGASGTLIEDPKTPYAAWRAAENAKRASLGWKPLHEIGG